MTAQTKAAAQALRLGRVVAITVTGLLLVWAVVMTYAVYQGAVERGEVAYDAGLYSEIGRHFLETGQPYYPHQFSPYTPDGIVNLYPPTALYLFVPASLLPLPLFWIVPLAVVAVSLYRLRPAVWTWPLMALGLVLPLQTPVVPIALVYGNTLMWTLAVLFAAAAFRPGIAWAVVFKPNAFPLALPFALRSWRGFVVTVALSAVLLPAWFDYLVISRNALHQEPLLYIVAAWPALAMPLVAWLGRTEVGQSGVVVVPRRLRRALVRLPGVVQQPSPRAVDIGQGPRVG